MTSSLAYFRIICFQEVAKIPWAFICTKELSLEHSFIRNPLTTNNGYMLGDLGMWVHLTLMQNFTDHFPRQMWLWPVLRMRIFSQNHKTSEKQRWNSKSSLINSKVSTFKCYALLLSTYHCEIFPEFLLSKKHVKVSTWLLLNTFLFFFTFLATT